MCWVGGCDNNATLNGKVHRAGRAWRGLLYELVCVSTGMCAAEGTLNHLGSCIVVLRMLKELGRGEEDTFGFGR